MDSPGAQDNSPEARIWIVLVQKSAKGPFTYAEVCELIDKGIIRRNDPAMKLGKEHGKSSGQWKILWQFAEFERRTSAPVEPTVLGQYAHPSEGERRKVDAAQVSDDDVKALMPEQLMDIQPEDLIQTTNRDLRVADDGHAEVGFASDSGRPTDDEPRFPRWIVAMTLIAVVGGLFMYAGRDRWTKPEKADPTSVVQEGEGSNPLAPSIPNPNDGGRRLSSRPNVMQPVFRGASPAAPRPMEVLPEQRAPEPPPREESRYDRPADTDLKRSGERGTIPEEADRREEDRDSGDEGDGPRKPAARSVPKAAVSEEDEPLNDNGRDDRNNGSPEDRNESPYTSGRQDN